MSDIILFGESHVSRQDAEDLWEFDFLKIKNGIFFKEGRMEDKHNLKVFPLGWLFWSGYTGYTTFLKIGEWITHRQTFDDFLNQRSEKWDFEIDKEIDIPMSKFNDLIPLWWKYLVVIISACSFFCYFIPLLIKGFSILEFVVFILFILAMPLGYILPMITLFNSSINAKREQHMSEHIQTKINDGGYEKAVVFCGDAHVDGIKRNLEKEHDVVIGHRHNFEKDNFILRKISHLLLSHLR
ncbi:MAG: hypothetical protein B6U72_06700 [Candidatus Altiarchaeales archaeon ex4484_2]|nr:MAG: hypothetical protein B6U72_06700 [Candidatus Altiarchaeales archaeon ex4484_2]